MSGYLGTGKALVTHREWCPAAPPAVAGAKCLCRGGTLELGDPRPELVAAAVARYRDRHRERYDGVG